MATWRQLAEQAQRHAVGAIDMDADDRDLLDRVGRALDNALDLPRGEIG